MKEEWKELLTTKELDKMYLWDKISMTNLLKTLKHSTIRGY